MPRDKKGATDSRRKLAEGCRYLSDDLSQIAATPSGISASSWQAKLRSGIRIFNAPEIVGFVVLFACFHAHIKAVERAVRRCRLAELTLPSNVCRAVARG